MKPPRTTRCMKTTMTSRITEPVIVDVPETKKMEFVACWNLPKNVERTQFEYKDHDPTRLDTLSSRLHIDFVTLKFVPETKVFRLDAGTVEALYIAVKHHDDMDTPVESTSKKPAARKPARK